MMSNLLGGHDPQRPPPLLHAATMPAAAAAASTTTQVALQPMPTPAAALADLANSISRRFNAIEPPAKRQRIDSSADVASFVGSLAPDLRKPDPKPPATGSGSSSASSSSAGSNTAASAAATPSPQQQQQPGFPPFPPRPRSMGYKRRMVNAARLVTPPKREEVSTKPYNLEAPRRAPQLPNGVTMDFYPWRGGQTEDALTEQSIRQGHFDKSQVSQNETGSARSFILGGVRHQKNGLQALSQVFIAALKQREATSGVTAKNTFKLPPRVTLTDSKREVWLRDLADPAIPLRRLSRSIPHGIRGKALLDQCLTKRIPTWRAVWLTKCVGANEIRAFKRKGNSGALMSGGEAKWVKDWTLGLNQFVEALVQSCGPPEWKDNMTYGMRLVSHIYSERLLDRDAFLDGVIAGAQASSIRHLPIWMLVLGCFIKDIRTRRRRGRRLVVALADQAVKIRNEVPTEKRNQLLHRPVELLHSLILSHPDCFLLPDCWEAYEGLVQGCGSDEAFELAFDRIKDRNHRICRQRLQSESHGGLAGPQKLISLLDAAGSVFSFADLSKRCRATTENDKTLTSTLLEWASTPFRSGRPRIYLAARLLRHWARQGIDLDQQLIACLNDQAVVARVDHKCLYRVIAELVRSHHFSVGKYTQTLMARGSAIAERSSHVAFELELLNNIPLHGLPDHLLNLRKIILKNARSLRESDGALQVAKAYCGTLAPCLSHSEASTPLPPGFELSALESVEKLELARWVRCSVATFVSDAVEPDDRSVDDDIKPANLSPAEFDGVCSILIDLEDYSILADIHSIVVDSCDTALLPNVTHTLNRCFDEFCAIGAMVDLFGKILERISNIKGRSSVEQPLFFGLFELAKRIPHLVKTTQQLEKELASCEPSTTLAACSPVSDQMAEALQNADATFVEEVETLLKSGTSMDKSVLTKVFYDIVKRVEASWPDDGQMTTTLFGIMVKVREFNKETFDGLLLDWLSTVLASARRPPLATLVVPLVGAGIASLQDVLSRALMTVKAAPDKTELLVLEFLEMLQHSSRFVDECPSPTAYRFEHSKAELLHANNEMVTELLQAAISLSLHGTECVSRMDTLIAEPSFATLLVEILARGPSDPSPELVKTLMPSQLALDAIDTALGLAQTDLGLFENTRALFHVANDFNVRLCQLRLAIIVFESGKPRDDPETIDCARSLVAELGPSFADKPMAWRMLLRELPAGVASRALSIASSALLRQLNDPEHNPFASPSKTDMLTFASSLLYHAAIADEESNNQGSNGSIPILEACTAALNGYLSRIRAVPVSFGTPDADPPVHLDAARRAAHIDLIVEDLCILLDLLAAHQRVLQSTGRSGSGSTQLMRLSLALANLALDPAIGSRHEVEQHAFDVLAVLADALPADASQLVAHALAESQAGPRDPRLDFLFGLSDADVDRRWWLIAPDPPPGKGPDESAAAPVPGSAWSWSTSSAGDSAGVSSSMATASTLGMSSGRSGSTAAGSVASVGIARTGTPPPAAWGAMQPPPRMPTPSSEPGRSLPIPIPYSIRRWEMVPEATPIMGENDSSLSLSLFGASRAVL